MEVIRMKGFEQDLAQVVVELGNQWEMRDNIIANMKEVNEKLIFEKKKKFDHKISMQLKENEAMMMIDGKTASYNNQLFQVGNAEQRDAFKSIVCFELIKKGNEIDKNILSLENEMRQLENNLLANKINSEALKEKSAMIRTVIELDVAQTNLAAEADKSKQILAEFDVNKQLLQIKIENEEAILKMRDTFKTKEMQAKMEIVKIESENLVKAMETAEINKSTATINNATAELNLTATKIAR
jgi:hypothetical protein